MKPNHEAASDALILGEGRRAHQAKQQAIARSLVAQIRRHLAMITELFFDIGEVLAVLRNNRMHLALGYGSFAELLERERLMSLSQASKLIVVAEKLPRENAMELGQERSFALISYARAAHPADGVQGLLTAGKVDGMPIQQVPVRQLVSLTRKLNSQRRDTPTARRRADAEKQARSLQAALRKGGARGAVAVAVMRGGKVVFRVELDPAAAEALQRSL